MLAAAKQRNALILSLTIAGLALLAYGLWIPTKALLAQLLLRHAWEQTLSGQAQAKPWPWADTWPVARLSMPSSETSVIVLAGASGRTLAFGPGHVDGTPLPHQKGNCVISAHRDTHFAALQSLRRGDAIIVESANGLTSKYKVIDLRVVDHKDTRVLESDGADALTLITCFPFDSVVPGGPLRYVVVARKEGSKHV